MTDEQREIAYQVVKANRQAYDELLHGRITDKEFFALPRGLTPSERRKEAECLNAS